MDKKILEMKNKYNIQIQQLKGNNTLSNNTNITNMKNVSKPISKQGKYNKSNASNYNSTNKTNSDKNQTKKINKTSKIVKNKNASSSKANSSIKKKENASNFIDLNENIDDPNFNHYDNPKDKGFIGNLFEKITNFFSLIQINSKKAKLLTFKDIEAEIKSKNMNLTQELNFLYSTKKEFLSMKISLTKNKIQLINSFKRSKNSCTKKTKYLKNQIENIKDQYSINKIGLSIVSERLSLENINQNLCNLKKKDLKLCEEINIYCKNQSIEISTQINELKDLMLFFETYIKKFSK